MGTPNGPNGPNGPSGQRHTLPGGQDFSLRGTKRVSFGCDGDTKLQGQLLHLSCFQTNLLTALHLWVFPPLPSCILCSRSGFSTALCTHATASPWGVRLSSLSSAPQVSAVRETAPPSAASRRSSATALCRISSACAASPAATSPPPRRLPLGPGSRPPPRPPASASPPSTPPSLRGPSRIPPYPR